MCHDDAIDAIAQGCPVRRSMSARAPTWNRPRVGWFMSSLRRGRHRGCRAAEGPLLLVARAGLIGWRRGAARPVQARAARRSAQQPRGAALIAPRMPEPGVKRKCSWRPSMSNTRAEGGHAFASTSSELKSRAPQLATSLKTQARGLSRRSLPPRRSRRTRAPQARAGAATSMAPEPT